MSTTYILHGGKTSSDHPDNRRFFERFTQEVDISRVKILLCYWPRDKKHWGELLERDSEIIEKGTDKNVDFDIAEDSKDLLQKLPDYDVLYVAGGKAEPLESQYPLLSTLAEALQGKVFAGTSMGVFMVCESYVHSYGDSQDVVQKGLGMLPLQNLCHWDTEKDKESKLNLLRSHSNTPIMTLDEHKFVTIYN